MLMLINRCLYLLEKGKAIKKFLLLRARFLMFSRITIYFFAIVLFLTFSISAQWNWGPPELLCDSIGENVNPRFAEMDGSEFSGILLWERHLGTHSVICMKDFANYSEIVVSPNFSQNPCGYFIDYNTLLIVWQSNQNGNFNLYSAIYNSNILGNYQQVTNDPGDDEYPDLFGNHLVWEREGNLYYAQYDEVNAIWGQEVLIDSGECYHPLALGYEYINVLTRVIYEKNVNGNHHVYSRRKQIQQWDPPVCLFDEGDNRSISFITREGDLLWQHHNGNDWDILWYDDLSADTDYVASGTWNETKPDGFVNAGGWLFGCLAYESDQWGNSEIMAKIARPFFGGEGDNISNDLGPDQNPAASGGWLICVAWESHRSGSWQIWGSWSNALAIKESSVPVKMYLLSQNYPNPFNPTTNIEFSIPKSEFVTLNVYNILGEEVATMVSERLTAGQYKYDWDASSLASGVYLYRIQAGEYVDAKKMILLR